MPFLPDEAVIEVPAVIGADGAAPVPVAPLGPLMRGLVAHVSAYEELAVEAALRGGRDRVAAALLAHPLIGQYDLAEQLTDLLLAENAAVPALGRAARGMTATGAVNAGLPAASSPSTAGTARPTSPWSAATARCSRWSAGQACRTGSARRPCRSSRS